MTDNAEVLERLEKWTATIRRSPSPDREGQAARIALLETAADAMKADRKAPEVAAELLAWAMFDAGRIPYARTLEDVAAAIG